MEHLEIGVQKVEIKLDKILENKGKIDNEKVLVSRNNLVILLDKYILAVKNKETSKVRELKEEILNTYKVFLNIIKENGEEISDKKEEKYISTNNQINKVGNKLDIIIEKKGKINSGEILKLRNKLLKLIEIYVNIGKEDIPQSDKDLRKKIMKINIINVYKAFIAD